MSDTRGIDSPNQERLTKHAVEVKAIANGGSIDWEIDGKKPHESKMKFEADSGGHEIQFDLDRDRALKQRGLRFDRQNPIFVHDKVTSCPTSGVDEQIEVRDCSDEKLTIYDKNNGEKKTLRYQLNFIENDGARPVCDPIIENGGKTRL